MPRCVSLAAIPRTLLALGLAAASLGTPGCGLTLPAWSSPGPAPLQQRRALRFDPYPENDVGPTVEGGRPRDYAVPWPELERPRRWAAPLAR